jgi:arsenite methyltransferase
LLLTFFNQEQMMNTETPTSEDLKALVRDRYGAIAQAASADAQATACCAPGCCGGGAPVDTGLAMNESYAQAPGHVAEADLGLGCGLPWKEARLLPGETVLDLGSGAGNDAFVAAAAVGPQGKVIGVDMTPAMVSAARSHAERLGLAHVHFRLGEIEHLPVDSGSVDAVLSNCVVNLVPDKAAVFGEMFRVLKPGGRFSVSDIVFEGELPPRLRTIAEFYVGCVSGASSLGDYLAGLQAAGFEKVQTPELSEWPLPAEAVQPLLDAGEDAKQMLKGFKVLKATFTGVKPKV